MSESADKDLLIQKLLQERDELYGELSRLRKADNGAFEASEKENKRLLEVVEKKDEKIDKLTDQLAWYKRKLWGRSGDSFIPENPNQFKIDFEGLGLLPEEEERAKEAEQELQIYQRRKPAKKKEKPVRLPLPDDLRREEEIIEPKDIDENWVRIGEEVTEILEHKPGELYVRRIVRPKYAKKQSQQSEEENNIRTASLPLLPLPRSNAGASLLAELLINKYQHHLPFHRQIAMFKQTGVSLSASTINGWFQGSSDLLRALYDRLKEIVLDSDYIQVDESTIPVVNNEKHKAVKAYLWMVRSVMQNMVFFHYDKGSRAQKVVIDLLQNYQGAVQTDGYEAYSIYEKKQGVLLLGCWAHARRKFHESLKEDKEGAEYALAQIRNIYKVEAMADDQNLDHSQRAELRKRLAHPILRAFEKWIVNYYPKVLPKSRMGTALSYTYSLFRRLSRYQLDGRYLPDNNLAENAIRPMAVGRKNYLFCGNHDAAENAAIIYSLLGCCKACGVNSREWLTDVLTRIPAYNGDYSKDLADLLPYNWKKSVKA
ncbi:MAG: IS66 family transposase [Bacteroidales bacterium]